MKIQFEPLFLFDGPHIATLTSESGQQYLAVLMSSDSNGDCYLAVKVTGLMIHWLTQSEIALDALMRGACQDGWYELKIDRKEIDESEIVPIEPSFERITKIPNFRFP